MGDSLFIVDDTNLNFIDYETPNLWFPRTGATFAVQGTVTEGLAGAKASVAFSGTAVGVFGIATTDPGGKPPAVRFSVDGQVLQTTTPPNNGSKNYEFPFFSAEGFSSGKHLLELVVLNATQNYPFALDFIAYQPLSGAEPTASQRVVTSFLPAPSSTVESTTGSSNSSSTPVGAIVGGVVGGVALLVATAIAVYFLCFRRRRNGKPYIFAAAAHPGDMLDHETKPTPYERPISGPPTPGVHSQFGVAPISQPSAYSSPSAYTTTFAHSAPSAYTPSEAPMSDFSAGTSTSGPSHPPSLRISTQMPPVTSSPNQPRSKAAEAGLLSVPQPATYHADSGIRFNSAGEPSGSANVGNVLAAPDLTDVPPTYSEA